MLREALENVLPYITNISKLREFVNSNEGKNLDEVKMLLREEIEKAEGTLKTDFRILLNELEKTVK